MPHAVPHSVFLGRIVRPGQDPEWTDLDRAYALAWQANRQATCSCGTRADEWDDDPDAYVSDHWTCEGCARLQEEQRFNLDRGTDGTPLPGQHTYLKRREQAEAEQAAKATPPPPADD